MSTKPPEEAVKISLKDCLACRFFPFLFALFKSVSNLLKFNECSLLHFYFSGCITSAETVMLEKQSLGDFIARINSGKTVIVSVSPQSRASLAAFFGLSQSQVITWASHIHSPNRSISGSYALINVFHKSFLSKSTVRLNYNYDNYSRM